jgi:magnesium-transporting ATPase (P-type)
LRGVRHAGLGDNLTAPRLAEVPFDSARAYYAALFADRLCVKGAPERLLPRCRFVQTGQTIQPLALSGQAKLLERVNALAQGGLRVLLAAEGPPTADPRDPQGLTALGFVGISDPLRSTVPEAVRRCLLAGVRVIMLTGDHPATARAIAAEAGLLLPGYDGVLRAAELAELNVADLGQRLEGVAVVARATPLDKLRIIESLQLRGHTVAMTGDGVNDSPSLRLADVGVAMGRTGTEVARQAADIVLVDDEFATLVEALVEGRGFWRNMRAGLGLLLGGNVGELGLIAGGNMLGYGSPLSPAQILLVNMITDALPSLAVLLQRPEHRDLAGLAREGLTGLDYGLRRDVLRRGIATAIPSLTSYMLTHSLAGPAQASAVAFTSVVATQLAQTLDAGRVEGTFSRSVMGAVGGSVALLVSSVAFPPLRNFLGLLSPNPMGWGIVAGSCVAAVAISRAISMVEPRLDAPFALPVPVEHVLNESRNLLSAPVMELRPEFTY